MSLRLGFALMLLFLLGSGGTAAESGDSIPELEQRLATATGSDRLTLLNQLAGRVVRQDGARAKALATEALRLAEQLGDRTAQATAHKNLAVTSLVLETPADGLPHIQRAQELFSALGDRRGQAVALGYTGMLLSGSGRPWAAIAATKEALAIYTELDDAKGMAAAANNLATSLTSVGELPEALRYAFDGLRLEERSERKIGIANNLNSIGNIYFELREFEKARGYYLRALPIFSELGEKPGEARVVNNVGITYEKLDRDEEAHPYFERSLRMGLELRSRSIEADARTNLGIVYKKRRRFDEAISEYRAVLDLQQAMGDRGSLPATYQNLAEVHLLQRRYQAALDALAAAQKIVDEVDARQQRVGVYRLSAEVYAAMGRWREAYENEARHGQAREALLGEEKSRRIAELQERFEAEDRQRQIELLAKDNEILRKDGEIRRLALARSRLVAGLLIAATVLVLAATLLLFRRYLYLLAFWKKRSFIGGYRIESELQSGGMGVIYRATSLVGPPRPVALKVIRDELAADPRQRQRFINEGRIVDALDHPGIVKVLDRGEHGGRLYLAMELLEGRTLATLIAEASAAGRQLELSRCLVLLRQLVEAVAAMHARGVIHRDISPANVLVVEESGNERAKLLDFGLAKADTMATLTEAGEILGTLSGLAPERIQPGDLTPASDTFSLGAIAYELVTSARPFAAEEPAELLRQLLFLDPAPPRQLRPEIPAELSTLILAMLAKDPLARPSDEELRHRLARLCEAP